MDAWRTKYLRPVSDEQVASVGPCPCRYMSCEEVSGDQPAQRHPSVLKPIMPFDEDIFDSTMYFAGVVLSMALWGTFRCIDYPAQTFYFSRLVI